MLADSGGRLFKVDSGRGCAVDGGSDAGGGGGGGGETESGSN